MKYLLLSFFIFLAACETSVLNTGQDITVDLVGTDKAYCVLSTDDNRYALNAPGTTFIERDPSALKIDCDDNYSERRRTITVRSDFGLGYWNYPETVTVNFATLENGTRYNGYRADIPKQLPHVSVLDDEDTFEEEDTMPTVILQILTEDSYSKPVETAQDYPVKKNYYMGRRSYPVIAQ